MATSEANVTAVNKVLLTHEYMGMPAIIKKTGLHRSVVNHALSTLREMGLASYQKQKGKAVWKRHTKPLKEIQPPIRKKGKGNGRVKEKVLLQSTWRLTLPGHRPIELSRAEAKAIYEQLHTEFGG